MEMWQIWLICAGILGILEIVTTGFLVIWVAGGCLIASLVSVFTDNLTIQLATVVIFSTIFILFTRPLVKKLFKIDDIGIKTNSDSLIGKEGLVIETIDNVLGKGQIKVDGQVWTARTNIEGTIEENTKVKIISINGVKAVVEKI
jgi:membrane protein implicated in regulation of membrane protease activity